MKRFLLTLSACLLCALAGAEDYRIRDIDINVELKTDGSALFTERWDVDAETGTEWYLVRTNLGDITISGFCVYEDGVQFTNIGQWDINASRKQKALRCGTVLRDDGGYELCWGIGQYGRHNFTVTYTMSNAVKSLEDYDMLHMQLVSPGLSANPEHVRVSIKAPESLSDTTSRIWGFGYKGTCLFSEQGTVVLESSEQFRKNSSVIALIRFEKGIFNSRSIREQYFDEVLSYAMEGASFGESDSSDGLGGRIFGIVFILIIILVFPAAVLCVLIARRRILGSRIKDIDWCRDIPFGGDLLKAGYTMERLALGKNDSSIAAAMILRMIGRGDILATKVGKSQVELSFNSEADLDAMSAPELELYRMMVKASGTDRILQKSEFSRWARRNIRSISRWDDSVSQEGESRMKSDGCLSGRAYTERGRQEAVRLVGFRKFLKDFTMIAERGAGEVGLWNEYLVFASLFGIADEVAKELSEINPSAFEEITTYDYYTMRQVVHMSRTMAESITNAKVSASSSSSGFGGSSSFGGGGGFSGGGFGGGGR